MEVDKLPVGISIADVGPTTDAQIGFPASDPCAGAVLKPDDKDALLHRAPTDRQCLLVLVVEQEIKVTRE